MARLRWLVFLEQVKPSTVLMIFALPKTLMSSKFPHAQPLEAYHQYLLHVKKPMHEVRTLVSSHFGYCSWTYGTLGPAKNKDSLG